MTCSTIQLYNLPSITHNCQVLPFYTSAILRRAEVSDRFTKKHACAGENNADSTDIRRILNFILFLTLKHQLTRLHLKYQKYKLQVIKFLIHQCWFICDHYVIKNFNDISIDGSTASKPIYTLVFNQLTVKDLLFLRLLYNNFASFE